MLTYRRLANVGVLVVSILVSNFASAKESAEDKGRPLLKAAAERSLFHFEDTHSLKMVLNLTIHSSKTGPFPGKYTWVVSSAGDWYKDASFANYMDVQVKRGSSVWIKRSVGYRPLQEAWIEEAIVDHVYVDHSDDHIKRYFTTSDHHTDLRCIELTNKNTLCFDGVGDLRRTQRADFRITYEYSDYRPAGKRFAPYKIVARRDDQELFEASIESLSTEIEQTIPEPITGAVQHPGCLVPTQPKIKQKVQPHYPQQARDQHQQGQVVVSVQIAPDGSVQNPVVIQTAGTDLDLATVTAIKQWQYEPAMCGNSAVEFETEIPVTYELR